MEDANVDDIKAAIEKSKGEESAAAAAFQEAQKMISGRTKEATENSQLDASLHNVQMRLKACCVKLGRTRAAIASGRQFLTKSSASGNA